MAFLYEEYNTLTKFGAIGKSLPRYVTENLRPKFVLRPYQIEAFARFIYFFERDEREDKQRCPYHLLYNMATGSGKTNVMAGLILYLFNQGYRDFLFFVNSDNIIKKTKDNFLNPQSSKYVFNERILYNERPVVMKDVESFDESDPDNINIKFTTIQQLHLDLENPKENSITLDDFKERKIVLLADEADNFNVATRNEGSVEGNWENTIQSIHRLNSKNILLEFTATMDFDTQAISDKYSDKAIFKYELKEFRRDKYSKEIELLSEAGDAKYRVINALILNLYRQVLAANNGINLKPIVLFKSKKVEGSKQNELLFQNWIKNLTKDEIDSLRDNDNVAEVIRKAFAYFDQNGITSAEIVSRTQANFRPENCINANKGIQKENQMILNSLEDEDNPIRAIFAVNKLDRGWDVLNLFDIVRMYDERNEERAGKIGKTTRAEAQLIGRGARYFPFRLNDEQEMFMRKYDNDVANDLRILETLYYHIIGDSRYISEIKRALVEVGMSDETSVTKTLMLKDGFKESNFYRYGRVVHNKKVTKKYTNVKSLADLKVRNTNLVYSLTEVSSQSVSAFDDSNVRNVTVESKDVKLKDIPYHVVRFAISTLPFYRFDNLTKYCPKLHSIKEFIEDENYLGSLEITFKGSHERAKHITHLDYLQAIQQLLQTIEDEIKSNAVEFEGSEYYSEYLHDVFGTKIITVAKGSEREKGQEEFLADKEWYAYNANYGTSEEKAFIELFARRYEIFTKKYDDIYIIRNEKVVKIVNCDGLVFEPDFLLYLRKKNDKQFVYQIFIEPKGEYLKGKDKWKEDFLKELRANNKVLEISTDEYHITGVPFYNKGDENEFKAELEKMLELD